MEFQQTSDMTGKYRFALLLWTFFSPVVGICQDWDEESEPDKTRKEYLLEQLVFLQVLAGHLSTGFETVKAGLNAMRTSASAELEVHTAFRKSLKEVSPVVSQDPKVQAVSVYLTAIETELKKLRDLNMTSSTRRYLVEVRKTILEECEKDAGALLLVLSEEIKGEDKDRLSRLSNIHTAMLDRLKFTRYFATEFRELLLMYRKTEQEAEAAQKIHGL
jgi:hypothetical protein